MIKHSTVFQARIIRIVEIIFLSLFIISLFIPYAYGVRPKEYFWDIWGSYRLIELWSNIVIIGFPLILSFVLLILISVKPRFGKLTLKLVTWLIIIIYSFIMVLFLFETARSIINFEYLDNETFLLLPVFSLFLFVLTIVKSKDNYQKIENYIVSIITIPVAYFFVFLFFVFEFGGYLLNICFAVLYVIAVLKVFLLKKIEENPTA